MPEFSAMLRPVHLAVLALLAAHVAAGDPPRVESPNNLTSVDIIERAYEQAGGEEWVNPSSLLMEGYGLFWRGTEEWVRYEPYRMWRVYPDTKSAAHAADGRVRIEALRDGELVFQIAFDGTTTYNQDGPLDDQADSDRWASNFGFGVIRHALDPGYTVTRLPDDSVDGAAAYTVKITDPAGGSTLFRIRQEDFAIVSVGFDTPRGFHERLYSDFFRNEEGGWLQPGRVRLYYDGVKANEIYWTRFEIGKSYPLELFQTGD
jgi:hypothetical protein